MSQDSTQERTQGGAPAAGGQRRHFFKRKKSCIFCEPNGARVDYKDIKLLTKYVSERGRMIPRRITSVCTTHQRHVANAVKRARYLALLPYVQK